jgi:hypothetical protein
VFRRPISCRMRTLQVMLVVAMALGLLPASSATARAAGEIRLPSVVPGGALPTPGEFLLATPCGSTAVPVWATPFVWSGSSWVPTGYPSSPVAQIAPGTVIQGGTSNDAVFEYVQRGGGGWNLAVRSQLCRAVWPPDVEANSLAGSDVARTYLAGNPDRATAALILRRIAQVPEVVHRHLDANGAVAILLGPYKLASMEGYEYLETMVCDYEGMANRRMCNDLGGVGVGPHHGVGFISRVDLDHTASYGGIALHEFGHAVDRAYGTLSGTAEFRSGPHQEAQSCWTSEYLQSQPGEWFAETFAIMYSSAEHDETFRSMCPITWGWFRTRFAPGRWDSTLPPPSIRLASPTNDTVGGGGGTGSDDTVGGGGGTGSVIPQRPRFTVTFRGNRLILRLQSRPASDPGRNLLVNVRRGGRTLFTRTFFSPPQVRTAAIRTGVLPRGTYRVCARLRSPTSTMSPSSCETYTVGRSSR